MRIYQGLALLWLSIAAEARDNPLTSSTSGTANFPKNGQVTIDTVIKHGRHPHLTFHASSSGHLLLDVPVGRGDDWKEFVYKDNPMDHDMDLRFLILHRPRLPDPLIVSVVKRQGGSDCHFHTALFGEVRGRLFELTPELPDHYTRGQVLLSTKTSTRDVVLTVISERYQDKDVHYTGPSRWAVFTYVYTPSIGRFVPDQHRQMRGNDLAAAEEDLISLFGGSMKC